MLYGKRKDDLDRIMEQAAKDAKGNYSIYHTYRRKIEELDLDPKTFEQAIRKLSGILKV